MFAYVFQSMLDVVREQVEAAKHEEDGHGKAGQDLGALETKGVSDAGATPDFEVAEDVDGDANGGGADVKGDQMREGSHGERALGAKEDITGNGGVAAAPPEAHALELLHAMPCFPEVRNREGCGENGRWARWGFLEEGMLGANGGVFVSMAAALTDILGRITINKKET